MNDQLASFIDHTVLNPDATKDHIDELIEDAKKFQFKAVCVHPSWVHVCHKALKDTPTNICTVIGFPLGANTTETKVFEAKEAMDNGATEIDMVINIGRLKSNHTDAVKKDIEAVVQTCENRAIVKVIIETSMLTDEEKVLACQLSQEAGAHFVKTSTGFGKHGATIEDVKLMRKTVGSHLGVKASGGIRTLKNAQAMIQAGATRIGTSSGVQMLLELNDSQKGI